jgi:RimJ/RimL family protein N-acetyltransferase
VTAQTSTGSAGGRSPLRTRRLLLRGWRASDREPFAALNADPLVREHMQGPMTRQESDAFVDRIEAQWETAGWGLWAVEVAGVAPFIGYVGLWPADFVTGEPMIEVGWRLAREHWGHGFATEGAREALRYGFEVVGAPEIVSLTVPQNVRSRRVMERIGMIHDPADDFDHPGVDPILYPHLVRHVLYRISRAGWSARR